MAKEVGNITTSHLALVLAGRQHVLYVEDPSLVQSDDSTELRVRKHEIAVEGVELASSDFIIGHVMFPRKRNVIMNTRAVKRWF